MISGSFSVYIESCKSEIWVVIRKNCKNLSTQHEAVQNFSNSKKKSRLKHIYHKNTKLQTHIEDIYIDPHISSFQALNYSWSF